MNRLRCFVFAAVMVLSSATFALGGAIQMPGRSEPPPPPTALTTASTAATTTSSTEEIQIVWPDATTLLVEVLLTIF